MAEEMSFERFEEIMRIFEMERSLIREALSETPEEYQIRMYLTDLATKIKRWWRRKRSHPKYYAVRKIQRLWRQSRRIKKEKEDLKNMKIVKEGQRQALIKFRTHPKYLAVRKIQRWWMNRYDRYWTNMQRKIAEGPEVKLDFRRATQRAITRIFEMYARDEEKHFTEEMLSAELEDREEFDRAFKKHILGDLWMLRFGREETQQKIEELWEQLISYR